MSWMHKIVAIIFLGLVGVSGSVYGACYNDCKPLPDCEAMGYKLEKDIFCPDGAITCPFDSRYKWCKEYTCKDGRYSDTEMLTGERGYRCDAVDYHKRTCYYCRCDPDPNECNWSNLNKGYGEISDGCCDGHFATCKSLCQDTVTVPAHAHGLEESCTGCGETKNIITDWECDKWWDKYNGECFPHPCEDNYTITEPDLESCGELGLGDKGWTWKSNGYMGEQICGKCTAKSCLDGFSTQFPSVESCGEKGGAGWDFEKSEQYAGDDVCGKCAMKQCPEGFESGKASADDCGKHGSTGWQYEQSATFNGNTACGKCAAKQCPAHSAVEVQNCGETGSNGYRLGTTAGWNGENECKTCEPLTCEKGTATTETGCGETGNKGWKLGTPTGKYEGETPCKPCIKLDCPKDTQTAWSDPQNCGSNGTMNGWTSEGTDSYNGNVQCYRCTAKQCPKDYDTSKPNVESCGTTGGWTWDGKDYSGDKICGKCTAKPCEGFGLLQCPDHGSCDTCQNGNTLKHKLKSCDHGWHVENDKCVEDACDGYNLKECPQHGSCGTCQKGATLMYKLESCHNGWNKVNDTCVMNECKDHAPTAAQCSSNTCQGNGWTVNNNETCQKGDTQTYQCVKKACPDNESTDYKDVSNCGTQGNNGWTSSETTSCNGDVRCYKCEKKSCAQGFDTAHQDVNSCGNKGTNGWNWQQNGWSGDDKCGKCTKRNCPSGYNTDKPDEKSCGTTNGWNFSASSTYNGEAVCGKCEPKNCPNNESTDSSVSKCGTSGGWNRVASGSYSGNNPCYKCEPKTCSQEVTPPDNAECSEHCTTGDKTICVKWQCSKGYTQNNNVCNITQCPKDSATSTSGCGNGTHPAGWKLGATNGTWSGSSECKKCEAQPCAEGDTSSTDVSKCGYSGTVGASKTATGGYSGDNACYKCVCNALANECKWTEQNKGTATLSLQCCDGNYKGCKSTCVESKAPTHANCTQECTGCSEKVCTKWECVDGYKASGSTCIAANCPNGYDTKYQTTANCPGGSGWKVTFNGKSGETNCGQCVCEADPKCKWNDSNKGNATLGDLCCNNMYATCHSTCEAATQIDNANCTKTCKGCDNAAVCVEWTCKSGYTKVNGSCVVSKCPQGSGITASDCGTHAEGWELGNATGAQSGSNACKECKAKSCSGGYSTAKQSVNDCTTNSCANYHSEGYSGDQKCGICYYSVDVDMPDHAKCAETSSCQKGTYCSKWKCEDGYIASGNTCIRHDTGCVNNPEPANATCNERCYLNGTQVCKKWSCNQKYTELNGTCIRHDSGCVQNDAPNYANCDSKCYLNGKEVCSKWSCKQGYTSNGSSCVVASCPDGSATSASNCGSYSAGWNLGSSVTGYSGSSSCYRCEAKVCPANQITTTDASACGTNGGWKRVTSGSYSGDKACYRCEANTCPSKETTTSSGAGCGTTGDTGWTRVASGSYAGDSPCYKCQARTCAANVSLPNNASCAEYCTAGDDKRCIRWKCNSGYTSNGTSCSVASCPQGSATTVNDCGSHPTGWKLGTEVMGYSGTSTCKKCEAKDCPAGEDKNTSTSSCSTNHPLGYYKNASGSYSGDSTCYKCVARNCPDGESTSNSGAGCGKTGANGWTRVASSNYAGEKQCYKCKEKTCNSGYSITYQSANDCSSTGCWKFSSDGYAGDKVCGKCTSGGTAVSIPKNASCSALFLCDKGSACSAWTCNAGYTEILGSCVEILVADPCLICTSGYECTKENSNGTIEVKCSDFKMVGYTCVKCSSGGLTPVDPVFPVDPDPTPTGCPTGYATQLSGCKASINETCKLDKSSQSGTSNGSPCYKCSCVSSGGGTLLPDCPFDCSKCGGLKCSSVQKVGNCYCLAKAPVGDLVP